MARDQSLDRPHRGDPPRDPATWKQRRFSVPDDAEIEASEAELDRAENREPITISPVRSPAALGELVEVRRKTIDGLRAVSVEIAKTPLLPPPIE